MDENGASRRQDLSSTATTQELEPVNKNYMNSLILDSDLMVTSEESELFLDVSIDDGNQGDDSTPMLITEGRFKESENDQGGKRVLDSLLETMEENINDVPVDNELSKRRSTEEHVNIMESDNESQSDISINKEVDIESDKEEFWDTDLEVEGEFNATKDHSSAASYIEYCSKLDVVPAKYYLQNMDKSTLSMKYHGLGPHGTKALAKSLESNISVDILDLSGNSIHSHGAAAISRMLEENNFISKIVLSGNSIGDQGVASISKALKVNTGLKYLDISDNCITGQGCVHVKTIMETSRYILELNLSKNNIDSIGACLLGEGISSNDILEYIDLSWNKIRGKGAISLANGIKENIRIKYCDLSYNGFGQDGGRELADMIRDNSALVYLNIEANRINGDTAALIGRALAANEIIDELKLGHNTMDTNGVLQLLSSINSSETCHMKCLNLTDIPVDFEIIKVIELIQRRRPEFKCIYGLEMTIGNTIEDIKKRASNIMNPIVLLKQHVLIKDKRLIDVLLNLDSDRNYYVTIEQFSQALQELGVPFKKTQLEDLRSRLDKFGNGTIYYGDFVPSDSMKPVVEAEPEPNDPI